MPWVRGASVCVSTVGLLAFARGAGAQAHPNEPVYVINSWPSGGLTEVAGRIILQEISDYGKCGRFIKRTDIALD